MRRHGLVVLTRPREAGEALARELARRGCATLVEPLTSIKYASNLGTRLRPYLAGDVTLLATSRYATRAPHGCPPHVPWIVSGRATTEALKGAGYERVTLTGQTAESLRRHLASCGPGRGPYVYLCGRHRTLDLETALRPSGYDIRTLDAYEAEARKRFSPAFIDALSQGAIRAVLFFSLRHAGIFEHLAAQAGMETALAELQALCLSRKIADSLALPWRRIREGATPEVGALVDMIASS